MNYLRGISALNSRILIGSVFTTAFAAAAYVWPEIFGEWFSRYMGGAFVFLSVDADRPARLKDRRPPGLGRNLVAS